MTVSADTVLLSLPVELLGHVVCEWIGLRDFVRLDSAYCNVSQRNKWHQTLSDTPQCTISKEPENNANYRKYKMVNHFVQWITERRVRARKFVVADETDCVLSAKYLDNYGPFVEQFQVFILDNFSKCGITSTCSLLSYCINLRSIIMEDCTVPSELIDLLPSLVHLQELHLHCTDDGDNHDASFNSGTVHEQSLLHLSCLTLNCHIHTVLKVLQRCTLSQIKRLNVHYSDTHSKFDREAEFVIPKIIQCTNLQTLALRFHLLDDDMASILTHCPNLEKFSLTYCYGVTDGSAVQLAKMPYLHTLCIDNTGFSDGLMEALAQYTRHTLHTLRINSDYIPSEALNVMLQTCTQLRTLRLFVTDDLPIDTRYMQHLTTLSVDARFTLIENVANIAQHCHQLQHLLLAVEPIGPNKMCFAAWPDDKLLFLRTLSLYGASYLNSDLLGEDLNHLQQRRPKLLVLWPDDDMQYELEKTFAYGDC